APMLGAWAIVVQCYGGVPVKGSSLAAALVARARFREFGWASVTAFAVTLTVADAAGLVVLTIAALTTVGLRVAAHRRLGGVAGWLLLGTEAFVSAAAFAALAALASARCPSAALASFL